MLKSKFHGLKRLIEGYPDLLRLGEEHSFNPHVYLARNYKPHSMLHRRMTSGASIKAAPSPHSSEASTVEPAATVALDKDRLGKGKSSSSQSNPYTLPPAFVPASERSPNPPILSMDQLYPELIVETDGHLSVESAAKRVNERFKMAPGQSAFPLQYMNNSPYQHSEYNQGPMRRPSSSEGLNRSPSGNSSQLRPNSGQSSPQAYGSFLRQTGESFGDFDPYGFRLGHSISGDISPLSPRDYQYVSSSGSTRSSSPNNVSNYLSFINSKPGHGFQRS